MGTLATGPPSWYLATALSGLSAVAKSSMVVAGTGVLASPLAVNFANVSGYTPNECQVLLPSTPTIADSWFKQVLAATAWTKTSQTFVVNFKSARDLFFDDAMACPCVAPLPTLQGYCDVILGFRGACFNAGLPPASCELAVKAYGTLGVRTLFGAPREPLYSDLQAARAA